jgi:hypothetical protein
VVEAEVEKVAAFPPIAAAIGVVAVAVDATGHTHPAAAIAPRPTVARMSLRHQIATPFAGGLVGLPSAAVDHPCTNCSFPAETAAVASMLAVVLVTAVAVVAEEEDIHTTAAAAAAAAAAVPFEAWTGSEGT